jgi:thiamine biosynthesis lipoprotein
MTAATMPRRAWVEQIMGLPISLHVRGPAPRSSDVDRRVAAVFAELRHVDRVLSPYRADSDLTRWERGGLALGAADPILADVLTLCAAAHERTDGWFDASRLPDPLGDGTRYDPSGLVKGWAVQRAARHLGGLEGHGWCLNAGGDVTVVSPAGHPAWRVGLEDPADPARVLQVVTLAAGAVATSGVTHRGAHIIDPYTGRPATSVRAVTVVGPDLMWADVYATAAAARGRSALDWLDGVAGYEALLVDAHGTVHTTERWTAA